MNREINALIRHVEEPMYVPFKSDIAVFKEEFGEDFLLRVQPFERPDILIVRSNKVLAIEHFEFDASPADKKGSTEKIEESFKSKKFDEIVAQALTEKSFVVHSDKYDCQYSAKDYIKNFKRNLNEHYKKVDDYKANIVNAGFASSVDDVKMTFFIVDTTALGSFYLVEDGPQYVAPCFVPECLDAIQSAKDIDYFFLGCCAGGKDILNFVCNRDQSINYIRENYRTAGTWEFWEPRTARFAMEYPAPKDN